MNFELSVSDAATAMRALFLAEVTISKRIKHAGKHNGALAMEAADYSMLASAFVSQVAIGVALGNVRGFK